MLQAADGTPLWTAANTVLTSSQAVSTRGTIYATTTSGTLAGIGFCGIQFWRNAPAVLCGPGGFHGVFNSAPAITPDGSVVVAFYCNTSSGGFITFVSARLSSTPTPTCTPFPTRAPGMPWSTFRGSPQRASVATAGASSWTTDGTLAWSFVSLNAGSSESYTEDGGSVIGADGRTAFFVNRNGALVAIRPDGTQAWMQPLSGGHGQSTPAVARNGGAVVACTNNVIVAFN